MNAAFMMRTLVDRLGEYTGAGQPLDGVAVLYGFDGQLPDRVIYGGGKDFDRSGDQDAVKGASRLALEIDTLSLLIRVLGRGLDVRDTEEIAEQIGDQLEAVIAKDPAMLGPGTEIRVAGGTCDYDRTDDGPIVILVYRLECSGYV